MAQGAVLAIAAAEDTGAVAPTTAIDMPARALHVPSLAQELAAAAETTAETPAEGATETAAVVEVERAQLKLECTIKNLDTGETQLLPLDEENDSKAHTKLHRSRSWWPSASSSWLFHSAVSTTTASSTQP